MGCLKQCQELSHSQKYSQIAVIAFHPSVLNPVWLSIEEQPQNGPKSGFKLTYVVFITCASFDGWVVHEVALFRCTAQHF